MNYIESSYGSDHLPVDLCIKRNKFLKGKGIRKFDYSPLNDKEYIEIVKQRVLEFETQYSCVMYHLSFVTNCYRYVA